MSPSLFFTSTGEVAYYTAGVAVVHDFSASKDAPRNRQRFFQATLTLTLTLSLSLTLTLSLSLTLTREEDPVCA